MVFSSTIFLFAFLPVTLAGYYLIRRELKNTFLLVMSLLFYAWGEPSFVVVMMASMLANYLLGLLIGKTAQSKVILRRIVLLLAIAVNLSLLFYYKYYDFFIANVNGLLRMSLPLRGIVLPIGISFFTFQGMSYLFDLYMGKVETQKNPLHIALYIALFPQLIAGPIVRYSDVNEQIQTRTESVDQFAEGVKRFTVGLSKKIILSNSFAIVADAAFGTASGELSVSMAWLGALAYAFQIYFDFGGYSDMAIGLGKMFGFTFLENFNYPYISKSLTDFWRRWHISLSSWFRDYVYIPLGGNRRGNVYLHLLTVFFLTGLWHGASWNFILWGLWHGLFLILERVVRTRGKKITIPAFFKWGYTMLVVIVGWVLFRAPDLSSALHYLGSMVGATSSAIVTPQVIALMQDSAVLLLIAVVAVTPISKKIRSVCERYVLPNQIGRLLYPLGYIVLLSVCITYMAVTTYNPFIYFNF